jgi:hypothetical protein
MPILSSGWSSVGHWLCLRKCRVSLSNGIETYLISTRYPLVYCISVIPLSVVRFIGFVQERNNGVEHVPSTATFAVAAIFSLSGACNVVLLLTTRPDSVLFGKPMGSTSGHAPSLRNSQEHSLHNMGSNLDDEDIGRLPSRSS